MKVKFHCTGLCGEDHPVLMYCKYCSHSTFTTKVPYKRGKVLATYNMMHGPEFFDGVKRLWPGPRSVLWAHGSELRKRAENNCAYWRKRGKR